MSFDPALDWNKGVHYVNRYLAYPNYCGAVAEPLWLTSLCWHNISLWIWAFSFENPYRLIKCWWTIHSTIMATSKKRIEWVNNKPSLTSYQLWIPILSLLRLIRLKSTWFIANPHSVAWLVNWSCVKICGTNLSTGVPDLLCIIAPKYEEIKRNILTTNQLGEICYSIVFCLIALLLGLR